MFTIFLVEKVRHLSTAHAFNLFSTICSSLVMTLNYCVIYIARSSAKSNSFTPIPNLPVFATSMIVTLSTLLYGKPRPVCSFNVVNNLFLILLILHQLCFSIFLCQTVLFIFSSSSDIKPVSCLSFQNFFSE